LTTTTRDVLTRGIPTSDLPLTFKDAVLVSRKLSVRYLWIDSLCIIQDDAEDWRRESSKMADVYANAFLTIAAAASTDDSSGCILRRSESYIPADCKALYKTIRQDQGDATCAITLTKGLELESTIYLFPEWMPSSCSNLPRVYCVDNFGKPYDPVKDEPLSSRGWTLQERILSSRIVHYGVDQMFWECGRMFVAEDGARFRKRLSLEYSSSEQDPNRCLNWTKLMEDYSRRRLTRESDKLVALAGLARHIGQRSNDEYYCAGVWLRELWDQLNWKVCHLGSERFTTSSAARIRSFSCEPFNEFYLEELEHAPGAIVSGRPSKPHLNYSVIHGPYSEDIDDDDELPVDDDMYEVSVPTSYRAPSWSFAAINAPVKFTQTGYISGVFAQVMGIRYQVGYDRYGSVDRGCALRIKVS